MVRLLQIVLAALAAAAVSLAHAAGLDGYDPVAYFTTGKATKGSTAITATHAGETFHFASAAHRDAFAAAPDKYLPQYGGHCAWAVAQGELADGDPRVFKVVDGKLYLNFNASVAKRWEADIPGFIQAGDRHWPKLRK